MNAPTARIAEWQVFASPKARHAVEVQDDSAALEVRAGDFLIVTPQRRYDCDCRYLTRSMELVRMQAVGKGMVTVQRGDGAREPVSLAEANDMIAARVVAVTRRT